MKGRTRLAAVAAVMAGMMYVMLSPADAQTFTNPAPINLPGPGPGVPGPTPSTLYPSNIVVSGLTGTVTDVNVTLNGIDCSARGNDFAYPEDVDILLVGPTGANAVIYSDVGGQNATTPNQFGPINITLDDQAATPLPADTQLSAGTYQPVDDDDDPDEQPNAQGVDTFPGAPAPSGNTALSIFNGTNPNGTYSLYVVDDYPGPDNCRIAGGWTLDIQTTAGPTTSGPTTTMGTTTTTGGGGANQPPVANPDTYNTAMNTTLTVPAPGVLANDTDPNGDPLTAGMPTNPANGTLNLSTNGGFTYTPNTGFTGLDTFTYMAHDPFGGMTTATVTINVTGGGTTTSSSTSSTSSSTTSSTSSSTTSTTQPTTTSSSTTSTSQPTTTSSSTTSTTTQASTTSSSTTTTMVGGTECKPGKGSGKPGKKNCHSGPPGQTGNKPGNGGGQGLDGRPVTSTRPLPTAALLGGLGVLLIISLVIPFRRSTKGSHRPKG